MNPNKDGELNKNSVVKYFLTTGNDGKKHQTQYYSLNAIITVGYRVNSTMATNFRIWATNILKDRKLYKRVKNHL